MTEIVTGVKEDISRMMLEALKEGLPDAGEIKRGPLHDNPKALRQTITLRDMDPTSLASDWHDRRLSTVPIDQRRFKMADDEMGGNQAWLLRGVVQVGLNFARTKDKRDEALSEAEFYRSETHRILETMNDVFQSTDGHWYVIDISVDSVRTAEQGGENAWIWTYFVFWEAHAYYNPYDGGKFKWL